MPAILLLVCLLLGQLLPPQRSLTERTDVLGTPQSLGVVGIAGDSRCSPDLPHTDWPRAMARMLRADEIMLDNRAKGGSVAMSISPPGWRDERTGIWQVQQLIDADVDLIVIAFGVNDINNRDRTALEVLADLSTLVGMCQQARAPFLVATVEFMFPPHQVFNNPIVDDLNGMLWATGWPLLDFAPVTNGAQFTDDGLHTNEKGRLAKGRYAASLFVAAP